MTEAEVVKTVWDFVNQELDHPKLFLFGSRTQMKNEPYSDFDFIVDAGCKIPDQKLSKIRTLADDLPTLYSIDIADYHSVDPEFLETIRDDLREIEHGKIKT